jgi:SH3-like domain-containing protein
MKILSGFLVPLSFACILGTACTPKGPEPERATVNAEHSSLRARDSATSRTLKVLEPGTHVEILERQGRWYRVRLDDIEGYMEVSTLLTDAMRDRIQENINSAINQVPQNTGVLREDGNLRVDPGRNTSILRLLRAQTAVEVLERRTLAREDAPGKFDAWLKVRTSPTEVGWLLSTFVEFDVPEGIAPYTEEFAYSAVKVLNEIDDPVAGLIRWYIVGERRPGFDPNLDFTGIRVFTWNQSKQRYETAFRRPGLRGVYPLEVTQTPKGPTFRYYELEADGKTKTPREFVMNGVVVREAKKPV